MAAARKKKKLLFRFEFGLGGMMGLATVCFCIFLWMFLFGVWTGQTILQPAQGAGDVANIASAAAKLWKGNNPKTIAQSAEQKKTFETSAVVPEEVSVEEKEPSFFSIQVAAFRDPTRATKSVAQWRARDFESFYLPPEDPDSTFNRVFVGQFENLAEANVVAEEIEETRKIKVFITLIPTSQKRYP